MMSTKPFYKFEPEREKVLVIGHDPRLQTSNTQAEYAFFADYYFRPIPKQKNDLTKYRFAESVFSYIAFLTSHKYTADQLILTNLCNNVLPHAPKGKTVLIPEKEAQAGINELRGILQKNKVVLIFAMSQQVNYWLQKLNFYSPVAEFLMGAQPKEIGMNNKVPYYEPQHKGVFKLICGKCYFVSNRRLYPILHAKNWPLEGAFAATYGKTYESCVNELET